MRLEKINFISYYKDFSDFTNLCCDSFVQRISKENNGILLGCYLNNVPVGVSVVGIKNNEEALLYYIDVREEYRLRGIGQMLFNKSVESVQEKGILKFQSDVILENKCGPIISHIMTKNNMYVKKKFISYKCFTDAETKKHWDDFLNKRGSRIFNYSLKKGFICESFKNVDKNIISNLRKNLKEDFPFELNPFPIFNQIDDDMSFISFKQDGTPVAYLVSRYINYCPDVIEVPFLAVSKRFHNSPSFASIIIKFITKCFEDETRRIVFCVDKENEKMNRVTTRLLSNIIRTKKNQLVYAFKSPVTQLSLESQK